MALTLMTLGAASLLFNETSLDTQFGMKARALLFYTALQAHPVAREQLAAMFWKDSPQERANGNLRMTLMSLRDHLGDSAHMTRTEVEITGWSDLRALQDGLNRLAPVLSGVQPWTEEQTQQIEKTLQLYKGSFLHTFSLPDAEQFELWVQATREAVRRQFFKAAAALMCHYEETNRYAEGLQWSTHLLKIDPLHEPAYRSLMRLYTQRGERVLAIREFETCKRLLAAELNVAPDQETLELYEQIVSGAVSGSAPAKPSGPVIIIPKRATPHNLPGQLTPLIGRMRELNDLKAMFEEARLITIVGTGGIGKTRLAIEFGRQRLTEGLSSDGIYFVDLSSIQLLSQVAEAVADVFDIAESQQFSLSAQITRTIKQKAVLLILDNFEHVLDAADQLEDWLKACPQLTILVTSREPLQLYGEYLYTVPSLPDADAWSLFSKRVNAVKSGFAMTSENATLIQAICTRLEGLPLALELAASHAQTLSLDQILQGLDDSLSFLRTQRRGGQERQRTMYGAIEWSYQLLTPSEQALYRLVSVFVGGWTLDAVQALGGELAAHLPTLVAKHLVQAASDDSQRFRLLESIREHAHHKLADYQETDLFREAHLHYFTALAETAGRNLRSNEQQLWFDRLESERDNLRAALGFADESPQFAEQLCRLMAGLGYFYYVRGYIREGREWVNKALEKQEGLPLAVQADLHASAGHLAHASSEYDLANVHHKAALASYTTLNDWTNMAFIMSVLSVRESDEERNLVMLEEAYEFAQRAEDDFSLLNSANSYAVTLDRLGYQKQARQIFEDIVNAGTHLQNDTLRPIILLNLAGIYRDMGEPDRATEMFEEIIPLLHKGFLQIAFPHIMEEIGDFHYSLGNIERAEACYAEGMGAAESINVETSVRRLYRAKAMIAWENHQLPEMKAYYDLAFNGPMDALTTEEWHSFMMGILHIAEICALKQQGGSALTLVRSVLQRVKVRKTRLMMPHLHLKNRCLKVLAESLSEDEIQTQLQEGNMLDEPELFAYALKALNTCV